MKRSTFAKALPAVAAVVIASPSVASSLARLDTPYVTGFRSELLHDDSRSWAEPSIGEGEAESPGAGARPIRLYVWYPAKKASGSPMPFRRYVHFDHLGDVVTSDDASAAEVRFREYFGARGTTLEDADALLATGTRAFEGAAAATGRFPLVLFGNALTARGFTYTTLCEYLAGHGYVVVSMPSLGAGPGEDAPFDQRGIALQLDDLAFAIRKMRSRSSVDADRLALIAWSVGGVTTALLQMTNPDVDVTVSLDSGTAYAYGNELLSASPHFDPSRLDRPFLQMIGVQPSGFEVPKDDRFYSELTAGPKYQLEFPAMKHSDFTSVLGDLTFSSADGEDKKESFRWVARYTVRFLDAFLRNDAEARAFLENNPAENGAPPALVVKTPGK
jgi:dienelactone hydrolase